MNLREEKSSRRGRSLSAVDFEAVVPFLSGISDKRVTAARLHLVDGETYQIVSDRFGWSRAAVAGCVNTVWAKWQALEQSRAIAPEVRRLPEGWERVTVIVPRELIPRIQRMIAEHADNERKKQQDIK